MSTQMINLSVEEMVFKKFSENTRDGICAYVSLDIPMLQIPNDYLVVGIEKNTPTNFVGVIVMKDCLKSFEDNTKDYGTLYLEMCQKAVNCMFKTNSSWHKDYKIGVLNINTNNY